ncbi:hypothetical protein BJX64DRAFT_169778 [Aspergillus heterothallicus]
MEISSRSPQVAVPRFFCKLCRVILRRRRAMAASCSSVGRLDECVYADRFPQYSTAARIAMSPWANPLRWTRRSCNGSQSANKPWGDCNGKRLRQGILPSFCIPCSLRLRLCTTQASSTMTKIKRPKRLKRPKLVKLLFRLGTEEHLELSRRKLT